MARVVNDMVTQRQRGVMEGEQEMAARLQKSLVRANDQQVVADQTFSEKVTKAFSEGM